MRTVLLISVLLLSLFHTYSLSQGIDKESSQYVPWDKSCAELRWKESNKRQESLRKQARNSTSVEELIRYFHTMADDSNSVANKTKAGEYSLKVSADSERCHQ